MSKDKKVVWCRIEELNAALAENKRLREELIELLENALQYIGVPRFDELNESWWYMVSPREIVKRLVKFGKWERHPTDVLLHRPIKSEKPESVVSDEVDVVDAIISLSEIMTTANVSIADLIQFLPCAIEEGLDILEVQFAMVSVAIEEIKKAG